MKNFKYSFYFDGITLKKPLFSKATMVMRFPAKKNAGCPKAPRDFPPRKDGILYPPSGCLGTPLPLPQSMCGRTDVRTDGHVTITSQPKFLGLIGYQISLAMELRWRALPAGSAIKDKNLFFLPMSSNSYFQINSLLIGEGS